MKRSILLPLILFVGSCQTNSETKEKENTSTFVPIKTYVIKSDAEAKHFIEPHIIRFRKTNPDFKVNIEYINRSKNIKGADIITLASPYPEGFPFELFDTIAQFTDTIVFVTSNKSSLLTPLTIKKMDGKYCIQIPAGDKLKFYAAPDNSPDIALLFDTLSQKRILTNAIKNSNDYNTLTEWASTEANILSWSSIKLYRQKKNTLSTIPIYIKNKPYTITREVLLLTEKNKSEEDSLFVEFKNSLR